MIQATTSYGDIIRGLTELGGNREVVYEECYRREEKLGGCGDGDWEWLYDWYLDGNEGYQRWKAAKVVEEYEKNKDEEYLLDRINRMTPTQLSHIHTTNPHILPNIPPNSPNTLYLSYLTSPTAQLPQYIQSQTQYITIELINNSYPTAAIVGDCCMAVTNLVYAVGEEGEGLGKLVRAVFRELWRLLVEGEVQEMRHLFRKERLQLLTKYLPNQHITQTDQPQLTPNLLKLAHHTKHSLNIPTTLPTKHPNTLTHLASYLTAMPYKAEHEQVASELAGLLVGGGGFCQDIGRCWMYVGVLLRLGAVYGGVCGDGVEGFVGEVFDGLDCREKEVGGQLCVTVADTATLLAISLSSTPPKLTNPILHQLLTQKSQTITLCHSLLAGPQPSLLPFLKPLLSPFTVHNLYQHNNTAIKFHQLTEHNPKKQLVFDSDLYRNFGRIYLLLECVKIYIGCFVWHGEMLEGLVQGIVGEVCGFVLQQLRGIKKRQSLIVHGTGEFYQVLNVWKFIYVVSYYPIIIGHLIDLSKGKEYCIVSQLVEIAESGSIHPLVRQYLSLILGKLYMGANTASHQDIRTRWRELLLSKIENSQTMNINTYVPIIFTLGYQLLHQTNPQTTPHKTPQLLQQSSQTFDTLIKYISCHNAYIRSIAQYHIKKKIELEGEGQGEGKGDGGFLANLCGNVWKNDKDCVKIMRNIGVAVQGFWQAMGQKVAREFLGYQRVEEYPSEIVIGQMRTDLMRVLTAFLESNQVQKGEWSTTIKKAIQIKLQSLHTLLTPRPIPLILQYKPPQLIVIASLLQKVHNFGYILRTLHTSRALVLVPSRQPLQHPQCRELIPPNSQVQVIEVKEKEVELFVRMGKKMGYPLVGLEQCAGSVKIQEFRFPERYMLLLGNQRIGAPASLLNLADVLVQIPQVGKVRSLNVHVSMVICLWQSIITNSK